METREQADIRLADAYRAMVKATDALDRRACRSSLAPGDYRAQRDAIVDAWNVTRLAFIAEWSPS